MTKLLIRQETFLINQFEWKPHVTEGYSAEAQKERGREDTEDITRWRMKTCLDQISNLYLC